MEICILYLQIGILIVKMSALPKFIYWFNTSLFQKNPKIDPHTYGQLIVVKVVKKFDRRIQSLFIRGEWNNCTSISKVVILNPNLMAYIKIQKLMDLNKNIKLEIFQNLNIGKNLLDHRLSKEFLDLISKAQCIKEKYLNFIKNP